MALEITKKIQKALDKAAKAGLSGADLKTVETLALLNASEKDAVKAINQAAKLYKSALKASNGDTFAAEVAESAATKLEFAKDLKAKIKAVKAAVKSGASDEYVQAVKDSAEADNAKVFAQLTKQLKKGKVSDSDAVKLAKALDEAEDLSKADVKELVAALKKGNAQDAIDKVGEIVNGEEGGDGGEGGEPGDAISLTTGNDELTGTAKDDVFEGVFSALSSESTLNAGDKIDGGEGKDTLKVNLKGNFTGFAGEGFLKNVETVELTNETTIGRSFDAKGVTGVEEYKLNGNVSLSNLADTKAAISISDIADTTTVTLGYTADAVKGTADKLTLNVNALGTAEVKASAGVAAVAQKDVTITANGIEDLTVNTTGDNFVKLAGDKVEKITVAGAGSISTDVTATTKKFDASANTGKVTVDLTAAAGVTEVSTGAGDDVIKAGTGDLAINAIIAGGAGNDRLELTAVTGTTQYQMSGVETVSLGALGGALTFSAAKSTGIETIEAQSTLDSAATFAGLGASDMAINLLGAGTGGSVTADHSGTSTVNVVASPAATATAPDANAQGVTASNSSQLKLNVGANATYTGTITAGKATSVEVNGYVSGAAAITAGEATSAVLNTTGASALNLTAAKLAALQATVAAGTTTVPGSLNLTSSTLTGLQSLEANIGANSTFTVGALAKANTVNLTGAGSAVVGNLGTATQDYGVTVNADGLAALTVGTIDTAAGQSVNVNAATVLGTAGIGAITVGAGATTGSINVNVDGTTGAVTLGTLSAKSVTVDAAGALSTVTFGGAITVGDTLVINGSELNANSATAYVTGASINATLNGGIDDDSYTINGAATTLNYTVKGDLGIGANVAAIDASAVVPVGGVTAAVTINASGLKGEGVLTITGGAGKNTIVGSAMNDIIITGTGAAQALTGGAGADTFTITAGSGAKSLVTIADFIAGEDILAATLLDTTAGTKVSANAMITALNGVLGGAAVTAANAKFYTGLDVNGAVAGATGHVIEYAGDVYAVTTDEAIKLVGVGTTGLVEVDYTTLT